ncbi:LLM class flavin-dependent oxidoreductase [Candidatus Bathyarchaeota archaeon]|nr:LLM class flavin-dependent oxidoreductase [Candidatus Bathyarchaeota archaeon]
MLIGLNLNVNDTVPETAAKCQEAERLGLDYIWVSDLPSQRYAPVVAAASASATEKITIGLGLISPFLHSPQQIASSLTTLIEAYGERFELCIGPGDRDQLLRVGVNLDSLNGIPQRLLKTKIEIQESLRKRGLECRIWLGAQGPRLLKIAASFDGVLLNYSSPKMIEWALSLGHKAGGLPTNIGVFAPAYVYRSFNPKVYRILEYASATVALGASRTVLEKFSLSESLEPALRKLGSGSLDSSVLELIPRRVIEEFSIMKSQGDLQPYLDGLKRLEVEHVVFAYPQSYSIETMIELAEALDHRTV